MKKITLLILSSVLLSGCPNAIDLPEKVQVKIILDGFDFNDGNLDTLKSASANVFDDFEHNVAYTELFFWGDNSSINIRTGAIMDGISVSMVIGEYQVDGYGGWANPGGSDELSFQLLPRQITVASSTTELIITTNPDCALILIADPDELVSEVYITNVGNTNTTFSKQGIYWYSYFLPDPEFQAHIVRKNGADLVINTNSVQKKTIHKVEIVAD